MAMSVLEKARDYWTSLPSKKRHKFFLFVMVGTMVVFLTFVYYSRQDETKKAKDEASQKRFELSKPNMAKEKWLQEGETDLRSLQEQLQEQQSQIKKLKKKLESEGRSRGSSSESDVRDSKFFPGIKVKKGDNASSKAGNEQGKNTSKSDIVSGLEKMMGSAESKKSAQMRDFVPKPQGDIPDSREGTVSQNTKTQKSAEGASSGGQQTQSGGTVSQGTKRQSSPDAPTQSKNSPKGKAKKAQPDPSLIGVINRESARSTNSTNNTTSVGTAGKAPKMSQGNKSHYVPTGAFSKGVLLTGLDAPTGNKAKSSPHPVLIRMQNMSFLPNEVRQDWTGCFVLGEGYGELSSERAYIRLLNLSCVNAENKKVIDQSIKGYVAGRDSKIGLRGNVVTKQGMFLSRALTAGFIDGLAKGFDMSATNVVTGSSGSVETPAVDSFKDGFKKGVGSGMSESVQKLSDFYMDMAEQIFPVIEIGGQRRVTLVLTEGVNLTFDKKLVGQKIEDL